MKKLLLSFALIAALMLPSFALISFGTVKADLDSVTSSYATINWSSEIKLPPQYATITSQTAKVYYLVRDDSKLAGYKNKVSVAIEEYDFANWQWITGGTGYSKTGPDTFRGKYNTSGSWDCYLLQTWPLTKYKVTMTADTKRIPTKTESREFYLSKTVPASTVRSQKVRDAAPKWLISRYEMANVIKGMQQTVKRMRTSTSSIDPNLEMTRIIVSTGALFGPTDITSYCNDSGMEFLELGATVFGSVTTSTLVGVGGIVYDAYSWGQWAKTTLSNSANLWANSINGLASSGALNTIDMLNLENELGYLATAIVSEANEAARIIYTVPNASDDNWKSLLKTEKHRFHDVSVKAVNASSAATPILNSGADAATKERILNFIESVRKIAVAQDQLLEQAAPGN
ncbi:MAG: hypothetical protein KKF06_00290 [Candidatus Margulisbacteria bacterium]|nr:hypothetical protein [Candidatus Margulisiibacteriota bacterium]